MIGKVRGIKSDGARDTEVERERGLKERVWAESRLKETEKEREGSMSILFCWLLNIPTTCECMSFTGGRWRERGRIIGERDMERDRGRESRWEGNGRWR